MGNWRWRPGRNYVQEARRSPPRSHNTQPFPPDPRPPSGFWQNSVPSWEKKFCFLVGSVPWQKVVDAKKFMYCHSDVVNWDDSAGEEAFHNAKKRFWAEINGLPCDISLPNPDIYIDDIDWNIDIDPALILDLDREYVAPDEEEKGGKLRDTNQKTNKLVFAHGSGVCHRNQNNCDNPWEFNYMQGIGASKNKAWGWDQGDICVEESRNLDNDDDNPWERSYAHSTGAVKDNTWGDCGDKSRGCNQEEKHINQSRNLDNVDNPWERGCQDVRSVKGKGWGDSRNNSGGWNNWENSINESRNLDTGDNPWGRSFIQGNGALQDRGWRDCGDNAWGRKQDNYNNEPKKLDSRRASGGWGTWNGGCRKREGSHQYISRNKSSRFQGDEHQTGNYWRKGRASKRVSFVFE